MRARLSALNLSSEQEDKVLQELAQLLSDASRDADLDLDSSTAVESWLEEQIPEWQDLGDSCGLGGDRTRRVRCRSSPRPPRCQALWRAVLRPPASGLLSMPPSAMSATPCGA